MAKINYEAVCSNSKVDLLVMSSDESGDEENLPIHKTAIRRTAIIDTLNVMHKCADRCDEFTKLGKEKFDAIGILLLVRQLLRHGFEVKMFIPDSFLASSNRDKVANMDVLEFMKSLGYLTTIRDHSHDDLILLEFAKCIGGFIISNDKYRDHAAKCLERADYETLDVIRNRVVRFDFHRLNIERTFKAGKEALSTKKGFGFLGVDITLFPPDLKAMFSTGMDDPTYGTVFAQRALRSQRNTDLKMEKLDVMCEYYQQILCEHYTVQKPKLPYFDPDINPLRDFDTFYLRYVRSLDTDKE